MEAGAEEAKVQFCIKAGSVLLREGYNSKRLIDLDMRDSSDHSWTIHVTGESIVPSKKDSKLQCPLADWKGVLC